MELATLIKRCSAAQEASEKLENCVSHLCRKHQAALLNESVHATFLPGDIFFLHNHQLNYGFVGDLKWWHSFHNNATDFQNQWKPYAKLCISYSWLGTEFFKNLFKAVNLL